MAAAGIVNSAGRANDAAFRDAMSGAPEDIEELARAVRDLIFEVFPQAVEVVWQKQGSVGWGTGPKKFTEQFAYLMPFAKHVTLGFYHGGALADPARLLPSPVASKSRARWQCAVSDSPGSTRSVSRPCASLIDAAARHQTSVALAAGKPSA